MLFLNVLDVLSLKLLFLLSHDAASKLIVLYRIVPSGQPASSEMWQKFLANPRKPGAAAAIGNQPRKLSPKEIAAADRPSTTA